MGFKIKAGLALGGMVLSWAFGLNFLSGVATYVDTAGNVLVDIADGIGMVSQGIEALENYLDPPKPSPDEEEANAPPTDPPIVGEPAKSDPSTTDATLAPNPPPTDAPSSNPSAPPPPVICKKGRCAPYDPTKDRVLHSQVVRAERQRIEEERKRIVEQIRKGELPADTVLPQEIISKNRIAKYIDD